jgi:hypothetical protein
MIQPHPVQDKYIHNINNSFYNFQVALISINGPDSVVSQDIKPSSIKSLMIEDTYQNFYQQGYIVIDNSYDVIEREVDKTADPNSPQAYMPHNNNGKVEIGPGSKPKDLSFLFKGEARDILRVDIMPKLDEKNLDSNGNELQQEVFRMVYDFAIYDSEEITGENPDQKYKKLYFWDLYYQLMTEKNVPFSTANYTAAKNTSLLDDSEREMPTGLAIQALINETFPVEDGYPAEISYREAGGRSQTLTTGMSGTDPMSYKNIDWDIGGSNIFFSAPARYKAIDSLTYLLSRHVSNVDSDFDMCLLHLNRYPRRFSLTSIKQQFEEAYNKETDTPGDAYVETVKIGGYTQDDGKNFYDHAFTPSGGLYFQKIGTVKSFSFDNMPGKYSQQELTSRFVHSYTYDEKQFNIDALRNSVEEAMKVYKKNYVNPLISSNETPPFPNFAPGQYRSKNINIDNVFSVSSDSNDQRLSVGRNRFLYASILTNNLISFRLPGSTHRQAGSFIGIDRDGAMTSSKFDDKLLGIYIIIGVKHMFSGSEYYTDLHCIKTYNFSPIENTNPEGTISNSI